LFDEQFVARGVLLNVRFNNHCASES